MFSLALHQLLDTPSKSLGTLVGVVVSVFLMAQQLSTFMGILGRVSAFADATSADIWVTSLATDNTDLTDSLPETRVSRARGTSGVAWASPIVQGMSRLTRPDGVREMVKVVGVERPRYPGLPQALAPGTERDHLRGPSRIFMSENERPSFGWPLAGERMELAGRAAIVGGFFVGLEPHASYSYVFTNIEDARVYLDFPADRVTFLAVGTAPGADPRLVKAQLEQRLPDSRVLLSSELREMEVHFFTQRTPVGVVFGMGTAVAAFIGAVVVAVTLYSSTIDRLKDFATLKAIGARRGDLLRLLLFQAWLYFGLGAGLGLVAFFVVKVHATQAPMVTPPWLLLVVVVTAFVSCTGAAMLAVRRVLALDPATVFRS